jgi:hypothetical protein
MISIHKELCVFLKIPSAWGLTKGVKTGRKKKKEMSNKKKEIQLAARTCYQYTKNFVYF